MHFKADTLDDLLRQVFTELIKSSIRSHPTRGEAKEVFGVLLELNNPRARLSRTEIRGKPFSGLGELLWYLSGTNSLAFIEYYAKAYAKDSTDGQTVYGGYGPRLFDFRGHDQVANVLKLLTNKRESRRAVIQLFDAADIARQRKEIPCTCSLQFLIRNDYLNMFVNMRSNDAFIGLSHDVFTFTMMQEIFARSLKAKVGSYKHFVGSLHLYLDDINKAQVYLDEGFQTTTNKMPAMPRGDPWSQIRKLLEIESRLRLEESINLFDYSLSSYWADLARLLQFFASYKRRDELEMRRIESEMSSDVYRAYLEMRRNADRMADRPQGELPLDWANWNTE